MRFFRDIHYFELQRATRGWNVEIQGHIPVRTQFTSEWHAIRAHGRLGWRGPLGVATAIIAGLTEWYLVRENHAAIPGEFELD
jgi:hypothetical protein